MRAPPLRVVHISTVHNALDPRIRLKQLASIAASGIEAHFVTADTKATPRDDGVRLHVVRSSSRGRLARSLLLGARATLRALAIPAAVYHFHDPELLLWSWLLLLRGRPVVYDIHEDLSLSLQQRRYVPRGLRHAAGCIAGTLERAFARPFAKVIAERSYARRFASGIAILNYPTLRLLQVRATVDARFPNILYTGNVTLERGAQSFARLVRMDTDVRVTLAGKCSRAVAMRLLEAAGIGADRLEIVGEGRYVPFDEIESVYRGGPWLAGAVLIPDVAHYRDKHLTKFFEYMAVGLPIIATDVPEWRRLIADQGLGLCVDPEMPDNVALAIKWLQQHPEEASAMGRRGRRLVEQQYNWESQARRLISFYRTLSKTP